MTNGSWRVDETYIKVKGRWTYLYRALDSCGQTIDFLLRSKRDAAATAGRTRFLKRYVLWSSIWWSERWYPYHDDINIAGSRNELLLPVSARKAIKGVGGSVTA